jgi:hypothetical protein
MVKIVWIMVATAVMYAMPAKATVCYTPDPADGMDTWYGSIYNKTGMPNDSSLKVGGWGDTYATLLRFNLSGLPQQVRIPAIADRDSD